MELSTDDNTKLKSFKNVKRYLHSHFHFLREAIRQHFQNIFLQDKKFKFQLSAENSLFSSHNIYNARVMDDTKANYSLSLVSAKEIAWEATTKLLLPGSVLCVSRDEFASCLFVTVNSQKPIFVGSVYILDVVIESETGDDSCLELYKYYDIIEAGEMGEVYKRTLALLKSFSRKKYLQTNLTFREKGEKLPHYWDGRYEILKSKLSAAEFSKEINDGNLNTSEIEISGTETSEQLEIITFNKEQKEAFFKALIKKVFLLKGSRGTGKTYVGLQMMKWLLQNAKDYIQGPILVVSYTSSNVDFILESSFKFTNKVMKLGERSAKNVLESYELCNIAEVIRSAKNMLAMKSVLAEYWLEKQNDFVKEQIKKIGLPLKNSDFKGEKYFDATDTLIRCISATEHILKEIKNYIYMADKHPLLNSRVLNPVIVIYNEFGLPEKCDANLKFPIRNRTEVSPVGLNEENVINEVKKWLCLSPSSVDEYRKIPEFCSSILMEVLHEMDMYHCIKKENYCRDNIPTFLEFAVEENNVGQLLSAICESIVKAADERKESSALSEKENASENEKATKLGSFIKNYLSESANAFSIFERASLKCNLPQVLKGLGVWQLNLVDRWRLFSRWRRTVLEIWEGDLENLNAFYNALVEKLKIAEFFEAVHCMVNADVVGVTARDVAKYYEMLQILRPRVIIIDEASEIIENEQVISLVNNTDHLIAIGENQCSTVSSMNEVGNNSEKDISLFERLINGGAPSQTLDIQYGIMPSTELLVPKLYSDSINHLLSSTSENIRGVKENMFFLNHEKDIDMISEVEDYEAEFLLYFCHYLLEQSYLPCQVTILTFSICQMLLLRTKLHEKGICEVRATTVSDFRDEQSDIILLACSNGEDESGLTQFFPPEQGAPIAVSRAKKGLYCTGNFDAISAKYQYWKRIIEKVRQRQLIGKKLALNCQTHPEVVTMVTSGKDFEKLFSSNNCFCVQCDSVGRQLSDDSRGRSQSNKCELLDVTNSLVYRCTINSIKALFCGHTASLPCYVDPKTYICEIQVEEELQCTHIILIPCFFQEYVDEIRSESIVISTLQCGREYQYYPVAEAKKIVEEMNKCSHDKRKNDRKIGIVCKMKCNKRLSCGHRCVSSCVECYCRGNHEICSVEGEEIGQCGHIIKRKCGDPFYECMQKCEDILPCGHFCSSPCFSLCFQQGYHEKCRLKVKHSLPCGHKENGLCGDPPPQVCRIEKLINLPCGHTQKFKCGDKFHCTRTCDKILSNGLKCSTPCAKCYEADVHEISKKKKEPKSKSTETTKDTKSQNLYYCCGFRKPNKKQQHQTGCEREVEKRLPCGHRQIFKCKDFFPNDIDYKCRNILSCGHTCSGSGAATHCVECNMQKVDVKNKEKILCSHQPQFRHDDSLGYCVLKCETVLSCGHQCIGICGQCKQRNTHEACQIEKTIKLLCGHERKCKCSDSTPRCSEPCSVFLDCGHRCLGYCINCHERGNHEVCRKKILKRLRCGHEQVTICGEPFKGCEGLCEKVLPCGHKCNGSCACSFESNIHKPCLVEIEKKIPSGHEQTIECKDLVLSTSELYCRNILPCGHRCSGSSVQCTECKVDEFSMTKVQENTLCLHQLNVAKGNPLSHYCNIRCGTILSCGHQCSGEGGQCLKSKSHKKCLIVKKVTLLCGHHIKIKCSGELPLCKRKCKLILCCGHFCRGSCGQCRQRGKHEECEEEVRKNLPCGHTLKRKCGDALVLCDQACTELLICGHRCHGICGFCHSRGSHEKCVKKVKKKLPCGHQQNIICGNSSSQCNQTCNAKLSCGHRCFGTCSGCYQRGDHEICQNMVKRNLPCGHEQNCKCTDDMLVCNFKCEVALPCGHQCSGSCGRCYQQRHHDKCKVKLKTVFPCGHHRKVRCGHSLEKCPCKCRVALSCGHRCKGFCARCSESKMHSKCKKEITKILRCGHKRKFLCSDPSSVHDDETCDIILSCGHRCTGASEKCCECSDLEVTELKSQKSLSSRVKCPTNLTCGHRCPGFLHKCIQLQIHEKCVKEVDTHLPCGHFAKKQCGSPLPDCKEHCLFRCKHSECFNKCWSSCTKCEKPCEWNCEHHKCKQSCGDICDRPPCYFPCPKPLPCGHACVGFCGEPCPPLCTVCDVSNFPYKLTHADGGLKRYVLLEDCGHVAEVGYLQRYLQNNMSITGPRCPGCGSMITCNFRFGNMIKRFLHDMKRDPSEFFNNSSLEPNDWRCTILRGAVRTIRAKKRKKLITYSCIPQCVKMVCNIFIVVVIKDILNSFPKPNFVLREKNKVILLEKWLWKHLVLISFQQIEESSRAVRRVALLTVLKIVEFNETFAPEPKKLLTEAKSLLEREDFGLGQEQKFLEIIHRMEKTYFREFETLVSFNSSLKLP